MKTNIFYFLIILFFAFAACDKQNVTEKQDDKVALENFISINQKYQQLKSQTKDMRSFNSFKSLKNKTLKSLKDEGADDIVDDSSDIWDEWETCAEITETKNDDGSITVTVDYGEDGCEEYGELIKGKIISTWKMDLNSYYFEEEYENYFIGDVTINGKTTYSGNWSELLSENFSWSGEEDLEFTFSDGETIEMTGKFKEEANAEQYTVIEGTYSYSSSLAYSFSYEVTKPLVYDYTCESSYIPLKGTEKVNYIENNESEEFIMDYGDGSCDNKYTITSNGVTKEYDYDNEDWFDGNDDWNDSDSTNVSG